MYVMIFPSGLDPALRALSFLVHVLTSSVYTEVSIAIGQLHVSDFDN